MSNKTSISAPALIASCVLALISPVSVRGQQAPATPAATPSPEFAVALRQAEILCERARAAKAPKERKQLASTAKERLLPYLTNPDETNTELWRVVGLVGIAMEDAELSAFAYEAILRLKPDFAADRALLAVVAELDLLPIRERVEEIRAQRPETRRVYKEAQAAGAFALARRYQNGIGVVRNAAAAREWTRKAAEAGEVEAMVRLGQMYATGEGVQRDLRSAFEWYSKAADAKNADAMCDLGRMYASGKFVPKDAAKAVEWYTRSAEGGSVQGMRALAWHHLPSDKDVGISWLTKAADRGDHRAMYDLGLLYKLGEYGVAADAAKGSALLSAALGLATSASNAGDADAMILISRMYGAGDGVPRSDEQAFKWLVKAANAGNLEAMWQVANAYRESRGVAASKEKYLEWLTRAAEAGNATAAYVLGNIHMHGVHVAVDRDTALMWWERAAALGDCEAPLSLARAFLLGEGVDRDEAKAMEWLAIHEACNSNLANPDRQNWRGIFSGFITARRGAESGEAAALRRYALYLKSGPLIGPDSAKAAEVLNRAATHGDAEAAVILGRWLLTDEEDLTPDPRRSASLFRKAAEVGYAPGMLELARLYATGEGVEHDGNAAERWYRAASAAPPPKDQPNWSVNLPLLELAKFYQRTSRTAEARRAFEEIVERKIMDEESLYAHVVIGRYLSDDFDAGRDDQGREKAFALYKVAADAGYGPALYYVGKRYADGLGVTKNYKLAVMTLEESLKHNRYGHVALAQRELGRLFETGRGTPRDLARALELYQGAVEGGNAEANEDVERVTKLLAVPSARQLADAVDAEAAKIPQNMPPTANVSLSAAETIAKTLSNENDRAQVFYELAVCMAECGDIPAAKRIAAVTPLKDLALVAIASSQIEANDLSGARDTLRAAEAAPPAEMATAYARLGDLDMAHGFVAKLNWSTERRGPNRAIVAAAVKEGRADLRGFAMSLVRAGLDAQAQVTDRRVPGARDYIDALCGLAEAQAAAGDRPGARASLDAARSYTAPLKTDPSDANYALSTIIESCAIVGELGLIQELVAEVQDGHNAALALGHAAAAQIRGGDTRGASRVIDRLRQVDGNAYTAKAFCGIAKALAARKDIAGANAMAGVAAEVANGIELTSFYTSYHHAETLAALAEGYAVAGDIAEARAIAHSIAPENHKAHSAAIIAVAKAEMRSGGNARLEAWMNIMKEPRSRIAALMGKAVATRLAGSDDE